VTGNIARLLNTTATVNRRRVTEDELGGEEVTWVTVGTVPARVSGPTGALSDTLTARQSGGRAPYFVYLLPGADVHRGDVLDVAGRPLLWVDTVGEPSERSAYRRAECVEHQAEVTVRG